MATLDLFDLLDKVDAAPFVVEAQAEYSLALRALKGALPPELLAALLAVDAAHGAGLVAAARAGYEAAGGEVLL